MWSSVNSSDWLSGASSARDSSDTVTPPSMGFGDVRDRDASFLIVDTTHPTLDCRTSRAIAGGWRERYRFSDVARHEAARSPKRGVAAGTDERTSTTGHTLMQGVGYVNPSGCLR